MASTINMQMEGIPDIIVTTVVINPDTGATLFFGLRQWVGGVTSANVDVSPGTDVEYYAIDSAYGGVNRGFTV